MYTYFITRRHHNTIARRTAGRRRQPLVEDLEGRQLLSTFSVTNTNSSGAGSLAQAISSSNATTGTTANTISFKIAASGIQTIALTSALPTITHSVDIDATTEPGYSTTPVVVLSGTGAGSKAVGLDLTASNSVVKGLVVDNFAGGGVLLSGGSGDSITDDYIGVTTAGNAAAGNGNFGVRLTGALDDSVTHDVISGNGSDAGIDLNGGSKSNVVAGDFIGTDATGKKALGNGGQGVLIETGSVDNTIGGTAAGAGNVISANAADGIYVDGNGVTGNSVFGNDIGTDMTGGVALGNGFWGIGIQEAADNSVGGPAAGAGNVISGNDEGGVAILGVHAVGDVVQGNVIGTNAAESAALGNGESGVYVGDWGVSGDAASDALIGGTAAGDGNVISSNGNWGVWISDTGTTGVVVEGNAIGTNAKGTAALGNAYSGVYINGGAENNTIGGTATGAGNVLSDNTDHGVDIAGSSHNVVQGNLIGTNGAGTAALGNLKSGVFLEQGADDNLIGGTATGAGNLLSGNDLRGIHITGGSSGNLVEGNSIGTNTADNAALGNLDSGVLIDGSSYKNTIGGTANGPGNTIAGNQGDGIDITDSAYSNLVEGNLIGTNTGGATNLGNKLDGVLIDDGSYSNTVGGSAAGAGNTISNNAENGVAISGAGTGNQIAYDAINSNANDGVYLDDTPSTSVIDCTINSNVGWGIWEESSSGYNFTGTVLKNNGHGNKIYYG